MNDQTGSGKETAFSLQLHTAQQLLAGGQLDQAAGICVQLVKSWPDQSPGWNLLSQVSLGLNKLSLALDAALRAVQLEPDNPQFFLQVARCYLTNQDWSQARKALNYAQQSQAEKTPDLLSQLGTLLFEANQLAEALNCYNQALQQDPNHTASLYNRAAVRRFSGDNAGAEADYRQLLQLCPEDFEACHNLLQLRHFTASDKALELIQHCRQQQPKTNQQRNWRAQVQLGYAEGKYFEDNGDYDRAFDAFLQAATLKRHNSHYQLERDLALMAGLPGLFNSAADPEYSFEDTAESPSPQPIFVVGLPRTGTTLVERILGSHSQVISGGELNSMPLALLEAMGLNGFADPFSISIEHCKKIKPEQMVHIRQRYLQLSLDRLQTTNTPRYFVDKLPFNALYTGYLLSAFPEAKVVHLCRHPLDAAMSNFKMLFSHGYGYSYDLHELGHYMVSHQRMMQAWHQCFPGKIYDIHYKDLVTDNDQQIRQLLDYCDLTSESQCFEFYNNPQASQTASASQVRHPIHQRGVGHWRHYEQQLAPLVQIFTEAGLSL